MCSLPVLVCNFVLFLKYLFIYFWLCWVFVSVQGLSLVAASGGHSSLQCAGLSLSRPLLLRSTGSRRTGSVVVAHGPSCSAACGIFPDQGSNPCPLHWQADSQPLCHQGSPNFVFFFILMLGPHQMSWELFPSILFSAKICVKLVLSLKCLVEFSNSKSHLGLEFYLLESF